MNDTRARQSVPGSMWPQREASTLKSLCVIDPSATMPEMTNGVVAVLLSVITFAEGVPTSWRPKSVTAVADERRQAFGARNEHEPSHHGVERRLRRQHAVENAQEAEREDSPRGEDSGDEKADQLLVVFSALSGVAIGDDEEDRRYQAV